MEQFEFEFHFQDMLYTAECRAIPLDGTTELRVTPLDSDIYEVHGMSTLLLTSEGSIKAKISMGSEEREYLHALAEGLSDYYSNKSMGAN
jgi:hypothetical protein